MPTVFVMKSGSGARKTISDLARCTHGDRRLPASQLSAIVDDDSAVIVTARKYQWIAVAKAGIQNAADKDRMIAAVNRAFLPAFEMRQGAVQDRAIAMAAAIIDAAHFIWARR